MDFEADEGSYVNTACWTLVGVSGLFLALRVYCKIRARRRLWWDDGLIITAWVRIPSGGGGRESLAELIRGQTTLFISTVFLSIGVTHGFGKHIYALSPEELSNTAFLWEWVGTFAILAVTLSKTSFAVTLLRVMDGSSLRLLLWFIIITMNVAMCLSAVFGWIRCMPVAKGWNPDMPGQCWAPGIYGQYSMFAGGESPPRLLGCAELTPSAPQDTRQPWTSYSPWCLGR